jgi:hypothetical protein
MFEARIKQGAVLKKVLDSVKDLVTDANFEADPVKGFALQAMDSSHVSLVSLKLHADGFEHYRCDRALTMGMNLANMVRRSPSVNGRRATRARVSRRFHARSGRSWFAKPHTRVLSRARRRARDTSARNGRIEIIWIARRDCARWRARGRGEGACCGRLTSFGGLILNSSQAKMLKCAGNDDAITMKADDAGDTVTFMFESPGA